VALVIEFAVDSAGTCSDGKAYRAIVKNKAQLAYNGVGAWLEDRGPAPAKVAASADLAAQLKLQDKAAQCMVGGGSSTGARSGVDRNPAIMQGTTLPILPNSRRTGRRR